MIEFLFLQFLGFLGNFSTEYDQFLGRTLIQFHAFIQKNLRYKNFYFWSHRDAIRKDI